MPEVVIPILIGREKSKMAIDYALSSDKKLFLVAQKNASQEEPETKDLYSIGVVADILKVIEVSKDVTKLLVRTSNRAKILKYTSFDTGDYIHAFIKILNNQSVLSPYEWLKRHTCLDITNLTKKDDKNLDDNSLDILLNILPKNINKINLELNKNNNTQKDENSATINNKADVIDYIISDENENCSNEDDADEGHDISQNSTLNINDTTTDIKQNLFDFQKLNKIFSFIQTNLNNNDKNEDAKINKDLLLIFDPNFDYKNIALATIKRVSSFMLNEYSEINHTIKNTIKDIVAAIEKMDSYDNIADFIASNITIPFKEKQEILECLDPLDRVELVMQLLYNEIAIDKFEKSLADKIKLQADQNRKAFYLNEQLKILGDELKNYGISIHTTKNAKSAASASQNKYAFDNDDDINEITEIEEKIEQVKLTKEAKQKVSVELKRMKAAGPMSAEVTVIRNYIDWVLALPWGIYAEVEKDLKKAQKILSDNHYGMKKAKERVIEYLAVQQRVKKVKGSILCLVGPPGVGKTSFAESIAEATGRPFVRLALGGIRDESEIRGHRKTYIGSMPGRIIQNMKKAKYNNPLFLLDEIDKMSMDHKGDPASALLEVLDFAHNHRFIDHYIEAEYDLSNVFFLATANSLDIPLPLMDRMEIIHIDGYSEDEKLSIAKQFILPASIKDHGLKDGELSINDNAILNIIREYTRESGVRDLKRNIDKIARKVVKESLVEEENNNDNDDEENNNKNDIIQERSDDNFIKLKDISPEDSINRCNITKVLVDKEKILHYLGIPTYKSKQNRENKIGVVNGLAYTSYGGTLLKIEILDIKSELKDGGGKVIITGKLGDVMKESVQAAHSYVTHLIKNDIKYKINIANFKGNDLHIHVPEGATPKDGPSAGITLSVAFMSLLSKKAVPSDIAMTGEVDLSGNILPIGGLREKLLAALRYGVKTVFVPFDNESDLSEIADNIKSHMDIKLVKYITEVFDYIFYSNKTTAKISSKATVSTKNTDSKKNKITVKRKAVSNDKKINNSKDNDIVKEISKDQNKDINLTNGIENKK